jgi:uncharacterized protein YciI
LPRPIGRAMEFETFTVVLFEAQPDAPEIDRAELASLQIAHRDFLDTLHKRGDLQVAGPFGGPTDQVVRGLSVHRAPPQQVQALLSRDPLVLSGRLMLRLFSWEVRHGDISFCDSDVARPRQER